MPVSEVPVTARRKREKIYALDFVRAVCAISVIVYHVSCYASNAPHFFESLAGGTVIPGEFLIGVFLIISGGVLYYNHSDVPSLRRFYYKRWRSLYPMFYISFLCFYIIHVVDAARVFYLDRPNTMILSVLGMDGYFAYKGVNYYHVGEWFFGAIVLLYILYPLFAKIVNRFGCGILIALVPLWLWQLNTDVFEVDVVRNMIYCSGLFISGMLIFRYELYCKSLIKWLSIPVSIILLAVPVHQWYYIKNILLTFSVFFSLFAIGEVFVKAPRLRSVITFFGDLSFPMFLVQNQIGAAIVEKHDPESMPGLIKSVLVTVFLCILAGWCLRAVTSAVMETKWFCALEQILMNGKTRKAEV